MQTDDKIKESKYFSARNVDVSFYDTYKIPNYLAKVLPTDREANILDIGCGLGQYLNEVNKLGYKKTLGIDISDESIKACKDKGINVLKIEDVISFSKSVTEKFDFITMSHVLEHVDKDKIIDTLIAIKTSLLKKGGAFVVMIPNGQSNTGGYWMYEDFTHSTLFTAGSIIYVLKSAGFEEINFLNPDGTDDMSFIKKFIIKTLLRWYKFKEDFWNTVTQSSFHKPSPRIYTFELKVLAR
ncbi:class I SAM-dependent methyltransferase [Ferruginibacter sp. SUN106]|uniref:class I SAM-dependent methyltransferase n=1 Tax=Ferruginibacter sp. SUN106 TaxID=2978348 RepID=UPI003D35A353